jgi:hypothetical protein
MTYGALRGTQTIVDSGVNFMFSCVAAALINPYQRYMGRIAGIARAGVAAGETTTNVSWINGTIVRTVPPLIQRIEMALPGPFLP